MKKQTCSDFLDMLNNEYFFSDIHSEMHWGQSYNSERLFQLFKVEAARRNVELSDVNEWDYDKELHENYKADADKGLS